MRTFRSALLASIAAIGLSSAALAQSDNYHVMTVRLPGGGLAQVHYSGNVAPQVTFGEAPAAFDVFAPLPELAGFGFGPASPFATMERISAEMDREAAAMFRQAGALADEANSGRLTAAALRGLPPGNRSYTFVSTRSGNGVCRQSLEITATGNGQSPHVARHSSGDCGPQATFGGGAMGSVNLPPATPQPGRPGPVWTSLPAQRAAPPSRADVIWASAKGAKPYAGLVREIPPAAR